MAVCNWLLNHVATKEYRSFVRCSVRRGVAHLLIESDDDSRLRSEVEFGREGIDRLHAPLFRGKKDADG